MKIAKKYGLTVMLTIAVLISFILSVILWANPSYERTKSKNTSLKNSLISKSLAYTYEPVQAIYTSSSGHQHILASSSFDAISEIIKGMHHERILRINRVSHSSATRYQHYLNRHHSIILNYEGKVTSRIFNTVIRGKSSGLSNHHFNRVVLPLNSPNFFYLLNDSQHRVYRVTVAPHSLENLQHIVRVCSSRIKIRIQNRHDRPFIRYTKPVLMPQYEYLINRRTRDYNVIHLLNGDNQIGRKIRKGKRIYSSGSNRLIFGRYQNVKYINSDPAFKLGNFNQTLFHSYHNLLPLKLAMSGMHYFDYQPRNRTILYREYVEGFPIFNPTQFGTVSLHYGSREISYRYSLNSLQIPIPNDRKEVRLPLTSRVLMTLKSKGYNLKRVKKVEIGYEWHSAKSSKILANLIPDWFIEYKGHWINYNHLKTGV